MGQPAAPGIARHWPRLQAVAAVFTLATFMLLAGCGGDDPAPAASGTSPTIAPAPVSWTLVLDYEPNAVHAGLMRAEREGYFDDAGIDLEIVAPSSTSDALTQVTRGRAELGLADLIDVARRNERSPSVTLAGAVVQRPLSGLIVRDDSGITKPSQLAGKKIAVSGLPSDVAVVEAIARQGGKPVKADLITLGFNGLKALSSRRVDATTAYWPADEVTLTGLGTKGRTFALDEFGGPAYPGLVAFANREIAQSDPVHVAAFSAALARGTRDVIADPDAGEAAVLEIYPELDPDTIGMQLRNYEPLFGDATTAGTIDGAALDAFAAFAAESGLTERKMTAAELTGLPTETAAK